MSTLIVFVLVNCFGQVKANDLLFTIAKIKKCGDMVSGF